jgi:hypothetical protein
MRPDKSGNKVSDLPPALNAAAATLVCAVLSIYLVCRHRHIMNTYAVFLIFIPFGIQLLGQFQRARGIVHTMESLSVSSKSLVFDLLFWAAITNLTLLIYIAALLKHIDGFI